MKIRVFATDIDGTLTVDRKSTIIDPEVVRALRRLEDNGVMVSLVSSNALPVVIGLRRYFGLSGPGIGESGALVYYGGNRIEHLTRISAREAADYVESHYSSCLYPSWQNTFRLHDYAFRVKDECKPRIGEVLKEMRTIFSERYPDVKIGYSGYAVHLTPIDVSKAEALRKVSRRLGIPLNEFAAAGDSEMDAEMISVVGLGIAVANSDPELISKARIVTSKPSGQGVIEAAEKIIQMNRQG
jgi:phosphoglycolate phosphatase (TIGR01487 family)